jgi:hypothetical protein
MLLRSNDVVRFFRGTDVALFVTNMAMKTNVVSCFHMIL